MPKRISNQKKQEIREYYKNNPITIANLAKLFSISAPMAGEICKNLPRWNKSKIFSPQLQENWFESIDNEEKAYYLGLFITDGNVCDTGRTQAICSLTQNDEDDYVLQKWLNLVKSQRKVSHDGRGCAQASILSNKMKDDLANYGVVPRKTFNTHLPILSDELMPHLMRGILDGDGNIEAKWYIPADGRQRFKHKISFCGTHQLMAQINDYLVQKLNLKVSRTPYDYKNKILSEIQYTNYEDIEKIGSFLYKNATVYLFRKKELYDLIKQRIELRQQCANS